MISAVLWAFFDWSIERDESEIYRIFIDDLWVHLRCAHKERSRLNGEKKFLVDLTVRTVLEGYQRILMDDAFEPCSKGDPSNGRNFVKIGVEVKNIIILSQFSAAFTKNFDV